MAKKNVHAEKSIDILDLEKNIYKILIDNNITTIGKLWELNRAKLKAMGLKDAEIKMVSIKMQLLGLDLNKKVYN